MLPRKLSVTLLFTRSSTRLTKKKITKAEKTVYPSYCVTDLLSSPVRALPYHRRAKVPAELRIEPRFQVLLETRDLVEAAAHLQPPLAREKSRPDSSPSLRRTVLHLVWGTAAPTPGRQRLRPSRRVSAVAYPRCRSRQNSASRSSTAGR